MTTTQQRTLDGGTITVERRTCEYYDGCTAPATFGLDVIGNVGNEEVAACGGCAREHLGGTDRTLHDVRTLPLAERWG